MPIPTPNKGETTPPSGRTNPVARSGRYDLGAMRARSANSIPTAPLHHPEFDTLHTYHIRPFTATTMTEGPTRRSTPPLRHPEHRPHPPTPQKKKLTKRTQKTARVPPKTRFARKNEPKPNPPHTPTNPPCVRIAHNEPCTIPPPPAARFLVARRCSGQRAYIPQRGPRRCRVHRETVPPRRPPSTNTHGLGHEGGRSMRQQIPVPTTERSGATRFAGRASPRTLGLWPKSGTIAPRPLNAGT